RNLWPLIRGLAEAVTSSHVYWSRQSEWTERWLPLAARTVLIRGAQLLLAILILLGLSRLLYVKPVMAFYVCLSLLAISISPWPVQYTRYLSPVAPYIAIALVLGLTMVTSLLPTNCATYLTAIVLGLVLVQEAISFFQFNWYDRQNVIELSRNG